MKTKNIIPITALLALLVLALPVRAQWVTQTLSLKGGWNAVYLHVDASHDSLDNLVGGDAGNPVQEVWRWAPALSTEQFVTSPQEPSDNAQWASWVRADMAGSQLHRLAGNSAYLVRVATNVATYAWSIKGKPVAPAYEWTTSGLNFLGFPTAPTNPPTFESFLSKSGELQNNAEIYYYNGGELGAGNPLRLYVTRYTKVNRGQAYWMRSGTVYNRYFAPFELDLSAAGVAFGSQGSVSRLRLRNLTASPLTVTLQFVASEAPPAGQTAIADIPPLLVRGSMNMSNLTYSCTNLPVNGTRTWTLAAKGTTGSEEEVVLGLNRAAISNSTGSLLAGVLRFSDSLGQCRVEAPVNATVGSRSGLWVGGAAVTQVGQYLKTYERGAVAPIIVTNGSTVVTNDLAISTNGAYVVASLNTNLGAVPMAYPLRLIVHNPASGPAILLQRVYCGNDINSNAVVATAESALDPAQLASARRISAIDLPWSDANAGWPFSGNLDGGSLILATVTDSYKDRASNPFLHGYHPDHDNLNSTFSSELPQGSESYTLSREITLQPTPPASDFASLTTGNQGMTGVYLETISIQGLARGGGATDTRTFRVAGTFALTRISETAILTIP